MTDTQTKSAQLQKEMVLFALGYFGMSGRPLLKYHRLLRCVQKLTPHPAIILHRVLLLFTGVLSVILPYEKSYTHTHTRDVHLHSVPSSMLFRKEKTQINSLGLKL